MNRAVARPAAERHGRVRPHTGRPQGPVPSDAPAGHSEVPHPDITGSILCLAGLGLTALFLPEKMPLDIATFGAWGALLSIGISVAMDIRRGVHNVVRTDLMALAALYFLTLAEFLFPQPDFNSMVESALARQGVFACLLAYAGLVAGRHLVPPTRKPPFQRMLRQPVPKGVLFWIFCGCIVLGYFYMLAAVHFDFMLMIDYFMQPRFLQPWGRGQLGDWRAMLYETSMILYLVPPLGGILLARRKKFSLFELLVVLAGVLFTLFYGFASGTRNIFQSYLVTFMIGYCFATTRRQWKEMVVVALVCAVAVLASTKMMLDFRDMGLRAYATGGYNDQALGADEKKTLAVDHNLYAICRMIEFFPDHHPYTNLEIPYMALIHPIPRVLWPGKPEGLSITVEDVFGANGWTVATSVVGEEYMMRGFPAIFLMSLFFGACCAWWNLLASPKNSEFGILVYASGFFSAVITMRSMNWCSTALLPTLAGLVIGYIFLLRHRSDHLPAARPARPRIAPVRPR